MLQDQICVPLVSF